MSDDVVKRVTDDRRHSIKFGVGIEVEVVERVKRVAQEDEIPIMCIVPPTCSPRIFSGIYQGPRLIPIYHSYHTPVFIDQNVSGV
jgi:hypothetical protein